MVRRASGLSGLTALGFLLGAVVAASLSCGDEPGAPSATNTVTILDNFFTPQTITVSPGTTLRWVNEGAAVHDVTQYEAVFMKDPIRPGETFEHRFGEAGTFAYACTRHPGMQGTVRVE